MSEKIDFADLYVIHNLLTDTIVGKSCYKNKEDATKDDCYDNSIYSYVVTLEEAIAKINNYRTSSNQDEDIRFGPQGD